MKPLKDPKMHLAITNIAMKHVKKTLNTHISREHGHLRYKVQMGIKPKL
jgi:hypothetical protein